MVRGSRFISTCRCFTWSTACFARFFPAARIIATAGVRATNTTCACAIASAAEHPAQGRRRLPQHRFQFAGADRRGICGTAPRARRPQFPRGIPERKSRGSRSHHHEIPAVAARRNFRHAALARTEIIQSTRRHARPDGEIVASRAAKGSLGWTNGVNGG